MQGSSLWAPGQALSASTEEIHSLTVELFGMFAGQVHPAFIQALILFVWCLPGSPQADLLNLMLGEYLQTSAAQLSSFCATCGNMCMMPWSSRAAGSVFSMQQLSTTQGHMRLDPAMSPRKKVQLRSGCSSGHALWRPCMT